MHTELKNLGARIRHQNPCAPENMFAFIWGCLEGELDDLVDGEGLGAGHLEQPVRVDPHERVERLLAFQTVLMILFYHAYIFRMFIRSEVV